MNSMQWSVVSRSRGESVSSGRAARLPAAFLSKEAQCVGRKENAWRHVGLPRPVTAARARASQGRVYRGVRLDRETP